MSFIVKMLHNVNFVYCEYCWDKKEYKKKATKATTLRFFNYFCTVIE